MILLCWLYVIRCMYVVPLQILFTLGPNSCHLGALLCVTCHNLNMLLLSEVMRSRPTNQALVWSRRFCRWIILSFFPRPFQVVLIVFLPLNLHLPAVTIFITPEFLPSARTVVESLLESRLLVDPRVLNCFYCFLLTSAFRA